MLESTIPDKCLFCGRIIRNEDSHSYDCPMHPSNKRSAPCDWKAMAKTKHSGYGYDEEDRITIDFKTSCGKNIRLSEITAMTLNYCPFCGGKVDKEKLMLDNLLD